jgi:hypothetical protein
MAARRPGDQPARLSILDDHTPGFLMYGAADPGKDRMGKVAAALKSQTGPVITQAIPVPAPGANIILIILGFGGQCKTCKK